MEGNEKELAMVKGLLRSVLMSSKEGVPAHVLQRDYREQTFESLPFQKFGFRNLDAFIESMPDVVRIKRTPAGEIYHAVADETTAHISKMVSKQRSNKKRTRLKPARRRPAPRSAPFSSPWTPQQRVVMPPIKPWPGKRPAKSPQNRHYLMIHSEAGGRRRVNFSSHPRALTKALADASDQRQFQGNNSHSRFEIPPRFRKQQENQFASQSLAVKKASPPRAATYTPPTAKYQPKKTSPNTSFPQITLAKIKDGKRYYDILIDYCRSNHITDFKIETIPNRVDQVYCYTSSTTIQNTLYRSEGLFGSSVEAEFSACRTACIELDLLSESPPAPFIEHHTEDDEKVRSRIKKILASKPNGLWNSRLPIEYKETYKEDPPGNILELVKSWKDIAVVEFIPLINKELFYPAPVEATPSSNKDTPSPSQIPLPVQDSSQRKDYRIPQGKPLPLGEKETVYITFIHNVACFCVQREDSPIDEMSAELMKLAKESAPEEKDLIKGRFVAAMYSSDESWSRAEIMSENPSNTVIEVLYVDFGNDEKCPTSNTRWLSEKLVSYPVQVVYCSLYGIQPLQGEDDWGENLSIKFAELVKECPLVAVTQSYTDDGICEVDLFIKDTDVSINQKLMELGLVRTLEEIVIEDTDTENEPEPLKLPEGNEWDFYVSFINQSSNSVVGRLVGEQYSEKLDEYEKLLVEAYKNCTTECTIEEDKCYVTYVDDFYHRIRVLSINDQMVECYFIDHGDSEILNKSCLKYLDPAINKILPYQAVEVSLYGLQEIASNSTTIEKLIDLALSKTCVADVVSREDGLSVILFDTSNEQDVNINEVIAKAVMEETETRMMAQGDFQPATVSTEISPVKSSSNKSVDIEKVLSSLNVGDDKNVTTEEDNNEENDSEGSWETEEEEEIIPQKRQILKKKTKDKNSNMVKAGAKTNSSSDGLTKVPNTQSESTEDPKKLYTWGKSSQPGEVHDYMDDEKSLWNQEYWKRPLPKKVAIPESGEYIDCHVTKVFDPTNFVCIPFRSMLDLNQLLRDCIEYFNLYCKDMVLKHEEIKIGHLYAGHQDGAWYRVLINQIVGPGLVSVYIVDFGEYNTMIFEEIKPLPWKFWQLPFQAFKCKLHGIKPTEGTQVWSEGAKLKMSQMAQEKSLVGLVCCQDDNEFVSLRLVDTSTPKDVCLDEVLLDRGMADMITN